MNLLKTNDHRIVINNIKLEDVKVIAISNKHKVLNVDFYLYVTKDEFVLDNEDVVLNKINDGRKHMKYLITLTEVVDNKCENFVISKERCLEEW